MITAGIDIGSRNCKLILWNRKENRIIYKAQQESGTTPGETAEKQIEKACEIHNLKRDMLKICATGYGRKLINLDYISEISCHGRGVKVLLPEAATVIDIGGQDSKVISLDERGFLEKIAELFRLKIDSLGELALHSKKRIEISSTCVVFAESEIISLINKKVGRDDILMGVHRSIAKRIKNLLSMIRWQAPLIMTGGVALNPAIQAALAEELQIMISVPEYPIFTGALGAALFASDIDQCPNERKRIT